MTKDLSADLDRLPWSDDPLEKLSQLRSAADYIEWLKDQAMVTARRRGIVWRQIEDAWERSVNLAQKRWVNEAIEEDIG
jgi:hypothetical protein